VVHRKLYTCGYLSSLLQPHPADGFKRLANQALFSGTVVPGQWYFVVDDFVGQGGTLANLIGSSVLREVRFWELRS
jgi:hypothetical protein